MPAAALVLMPAAALVLMPAAALVLVPAAALVLVPAAADRLAQRAMHRECCENVAVPRIHVSRSRRSGVCMFSWHGVNHQNELRVKKN